MRERGWARREMMGEERGREGGLEMSEGGRGVWERGWGEK